MLQVPDGRRLEPDHGSRGRTGTVASASVGASS